MFDRNMVFRIWSKAAYEILCAVCEAHYFVDWAIITAADEASHNYGCPYCGRINVLSPELQQQARQLGPYSVEEQNASIAICRKECERRQEIAHND